MAEQELWTHAKTRIHAGRTHMWNRSGRMPEGCDELQRRAVLHDPTAQVMSLSALPREQGTKVLECPLGHADFVTAQLEAIARKHQVLLQAIPNIRDVQSSCLLLLHCAGARVARCPARLGGPFRKNPRCQFVAVHVQDLGDSGDPL